MPLVGGGLSCDFIYETLALFEERSLALAFGVLHPDLCPVTMGDPHSS